MDTLRAQTLGPVLEAALEESQLAPAPAAPARRAVARAARLGVVAVDAAAIAAAMAAAYHLQSATVLDAGGAYDQVSVASLPLWLAAFHRYHLYNSRHVASSRHELGRIVHAVALGVVLTGLVAYGLDQVVAREWLFALFGFAATAVALERALVRRAFARLRRKGYFVRRVVLVGTGDEATALATMLQQRRELGYQIVALFGNGRPVDARLPAHLKVLDPGNDPAAAVRSVGAGGVIVATTDVGVDATNRLIRRLTDDGIHVEISSSLCDIDAERLSVRPLGSFPMMYVEPVKRDGWRPAAKRAFDVGVAMVALVVSAPLLALAALAIKATSPGPVMFRQERVGWHGRRFWIYKLRSMYVDGDERLRAAGVGQPGGPVVKLRRDPRVTAVGHVLRKLSLDELPQLLNVVRGEMSLVGPRPEQPCEVVLWTPAQFDRLRVRPGLTGVWQISGRSDAREAKDRLDLYYVDNWSMWRDVSIMARTVPVVLSSKGAY